MNTTEQKQFELTIASDSIISTDPDFSMDNLSTGDKFQPVDVYFVNSHNEIIRRNYERNENRISNKTLPRLVCQIFEMQIEALTPDEKISFPICRYTATSPTICGIFESEDEFRKECKDSMEYVVYKYKGEKKFVFYSWNIFTTIIFVQECLKRFGENTGKFVLRYCAKELQEIPESNISGSPDYQISYSEKLLESKNIIFRGAPGTGKTYLAKQIAADIISKGAHSDYSKLTWEEKEQIEFVQFHPSYDYSDFVEGLRPRINNDGTMCFELYDGIFKKFVHKAMANYKAAQKTDDDIKADVSAREMCETYFKNLDTEKSLETKRKSEFFVEDVDERFIYLHIPKNEKSNRVRLRMDELVEMLKSPQKFELAKDVTVFFKRSAGYQEDSYLLTLYNEIKSSECDIKINHVNREAVKPYVFIIDEINRGEISKIFGELFFSVDPGYRGIAGEVSTQYSNMHIAGEKKFYIPENVYIIGTMNDIDRSVDSFDFAMRRRFRFIEIKAEERLEMLNILGDIKSITVKRMTALNREISAIDELNDNYHIGAAYFLKLKDISVQDLWDDYLEPLLQDYVRGMYDEASVMNKFKKAYMLAGDTDETN